jgi:hypothetical protein
MLTILKKIGFVIGAIFKTILILLIVVLIVVLIAVAVPVSYFAWRMNQPLRYKDFNGLTYYQYQDWVSMEYQINENSGKYKKGQCKGQDTFYKTLDLTLLPLQGFISAFDGLIGKPNPARGLMDFLPDDYYVHATYEAAYTWHYGMPINATTKTTIWNFLPKWWNACEFLFWYTSGPQNFSKYLCPIRAHVPTPAEYQAMKQAAQQAGVVK